MMSYQDDSIDWQIIHYVDNWLDDEIPKHYRDQPLAQDWARISKVIEELGEAVSAMIGATGQNPRKGITHHGDDILNELADVVMTGILAINHFTKDTNMTRDVLRKKQEFIYRRMMYLEEKK
jgi:hypothetical protein